MIKLLTYCNFKEIFDNIMVICIKETLNLLAANDITYTSPNSIFEYKKLITKLAILFNYTDNGLFSEIEEYLNKTKFKNKDIEKEVRNIFESYKGKGRIKRPDNN